MNFDSKDRRKSIKIWLSDEERILVEEKAKYYGYHKLAKYVRDACIYEKVTYFNLKDKEEIYKAFAEYTKEIQNVINEIKHIKTYATKLTSENQKELQERINDIFKNQKAMLKLIGNKMDFEVWKRINHLKLEEGE